MSEKYLPLSPEEDLLLLTLIAIIAGFVAEIRIRLIEVRAGLTAQKNNNENDSNDEKFREIQRKEEVVKKSFTFLILMEFPLIFSGLSLLAKIMIASASSC